MNSFLLLFVAVDRDRLSGGLLRQEDKSNGCDGKSSTYIYIYFFFKPETKHISKLFKKKRLNQVRFLIRIEILSSVDKVTMKKISEK